MDNTKARRMRADGTYRRVTTGRLPVCAQKVFMEDAWPPPPRALRKRENSPEFWKRFFRAGNPW